MSGIFFAYISTMNFLGHLYFSNNDTDLMHANLFGDFVRGSDLSMYPEIIQRGIRLHRTIDSYIDNHPAVIDLMHELYPILPKISGIAVDLFFDHLLAKNWSDFHESSLEEFTVRFYEAPLKHKEFYSEHFLMVLDRMRAKNWLYQYQFSYGLMKASKGVSSRISFENNLDTAHHVFEKMETRIEKAFRIYMTDAIPYFESYELSQKS